MKYLSVILSVILLSSCGSNKKDVISNLSLNSYNPNSTINFSGLYRKKGKGFEYNLFLNSIDSSFRLLKEYSGLELTRGTCEGRWFIKKDTIYLRCNEEPFPAQITSGYITKRLQKVLIISNLRLKLENEILIKIN